MAALLFLPWLVWWGLWLVLTVAAAVPPRRSRARHPTGASVDVLVPAHNEEEALPRLLASLEPGVSAGLVGTVVVVADRCTDETAAIARGWGATVVERWGGIPGKPGALATGAAAIDRLPARATALLVLDADCVCSPHLVEEVACFVADGDALLQCVYDVEPPAAGSAARAGALAFGLRNVVRARGLDRMGLPVQLTGTGMVFSTELTRRLGETAGLAEDLELSYALLRDGIGARLVPGATVSSPLSEDEQALVDQRLRWEVGNARAWTAVPRLLASLVRRRRWREATAAVDWSAPPMLVTLPGLAAVTAAAAVLVRTGRASARVLYLAPVSLAMLAAHMVLGILLLGGRRALVETVRTLPGYLRWKLRLYRRLAAEHRGLEWTRSARGEAAGGGDTA